MNVLVVDDNEKNRKVLRTLFNAHQIVTGEVADGVQALELLGREKFDVVVSDILMPNMDGFRLCFEIRSTQQFHDVGVILYTANDFTLAAQKQALELGADRFLKKEGSTANILHAIREVCREIGYPERRNKPQVSVYPELQIMKEYSQVMIEKLEERTTELELARDELTRTNEILEKRVKERTAELEAANKELETFSYSVSHDLRAPLRWIEAYSTMLANECGEQFDAKGKEYLQNIQKAQVRMSHLISDLLVLARVSKGKLRQEHVDLSTMSKDILEKLASAEPASAAEFVIMPQLETKGDESLLRIALENLFSNAWKFSGKANQRRIEFGRKDFDGQLTYFVRDNGVGFNTNYAQNLFNPFQRFHPDSEFPGTGVGLATAQRVIHRHGGRIWAESKVDQGATFYFTLG